MVNGTLIKEGRTSFIVPEDHSAGGPGKIVDSVFFNEQMAFNRDVSVMFLKAMDKEMTVCDAMAATGFLFKSMGDFRATAQPFAETHA